MRGFLSNSLWLFVDKISKLLLGLYTTALIAKHIGPNQFGIWNYVIALFAIIAVFSTLGLDKIIVKELLQHPDNQQDILSSALILKLSAGIISFLGYISIVYLTKTDDSIYFYCAFVTSLNFFLQTFDVFDYYFQSKNKIQFVVIPRVIIFLLFSVIKIYFIFITPQKLIFFVWLTFFESLCTYLLVIVIAIKLKVLEKVNVNIEKTRRILKQGFPLMFAGLAVIVYVKIDQLLLDKFSTPFELGQYVAASRISELWYVIPVIFATALLPTLIQKEKEDNANYLITIEIWLRFSFWLSVLICIGVSLFSSYLINFLYGNLFIESSAILIIHIWASISVFLGVVLSQYFIIEGKTNINLISTIIGCLMNIIANIILIPKYGGRGAAISTVISYSMVFVVMLIMDKNKNLKKMLFKAIYINLFFRDINQLYTTKFKNIKHV